MTDVDLFGDPINKPSLGILADRFGGVPPFSVLNAREGEWQDRKRKWLSLGIQSEIGRGVNLLGMSEAVLAGGYDEAGLSKADKRATPSGGTGANSCCLMKGSDGYRSVKERQYSPEENQHLDESQRKALGFYAASYGGEAGTLDRGNGGATGTSIFDPVLCELAYRWWCPPGGLILDPFAGGSVRGIIAGVLGRRYHGIDLRPEQVKANGEQRDEILSGDQALAVNWICGDSRTEAKRAPMADFVFSCPPYGDLEVYSEDPKDLSYVAAKDFDRFVLDYRTIIDGACARLKDNRFACFVIGDFRDQRGIYRNFVSLTIDAFRSAGLRYYNEGILVTSVGSLPMRMSGQFNGGRKLGKTHQNIVVFVKGDWEEASKKCEQM